MKRLAEVFEHIPASAEWDWITLHRWLKECHTAMVEDENVAVDDAQLLELIVNISSMHLTIEGGKASYTPMCVRDDRSSFHLELLIEEDLRQISGLLDTNVIDNPMLRGRLADILWLKSPKRNPDHASACVGDYLSIPLSLAQWTSDGVAHWTRALQLARQIKKAMPDKEAEIQGAILGNFFSASVDDGLWALHLSKFMLDNKLAKSEAQDIVVALETAAAEFQSHGSFELVEMSLKDAIDWCGTFRGTDRKSTLIYKLIALKIQQADEAVKSSAMNDLAAIKFYSDAIELITSLPKLEQDRWSLSELKSARQTLLNSADTMSAKISSRTVDVTSLKDEAIAIVTGKNCEEALFAFLNFCSLVDAEALKKNARSAAARPSLSDIIGRAKVAPDGRISATVPGMSFGEDPKGDERATLDRAFRGMEIHVGLKAMAEILPALERLRDEHPMREADFQAIVSKTSCVPRSAQLAWAKGLNAGYQGDFLVAIHLLVPRLEAMVRDALRQQGIETRKSEKNGVEMEKALGSLLELPGAEDALGSSLHFTFDALLGNPLGVNLRNKIAHGLLTDNEDSSSAVVYTWWLAFRLVYNDFFVTNGLAKPCGWIAQRDGHPIERGDDQNFER